VHLFGLSHVCVFSTRVWREYNDYVKVLNKTPTL